MRIKLKLHRRFSLEKFFLFVAILCISSFALLEHMSISIPLFSAVKYPLLYIGGICIVSQIDLLVRTFMKKKFFYVWLVVLALCALLVLSAYDNRSPRIGVFPVNSTMRLVLFLIELMCLMVWVSEKGYGDYLISFLFYYVLLLVVVTDVLMFVGVKFYDGTHEAYLVGTKFIVSYLHMELFTLWFLKAGDRSVIRNIPKLGLVAGAVLLIAISIRVQCMTGVLGCVILFICFLLIDRPSRKGLNILNSPVVLLLALIFNLVFPFISELLVSIPFVNFFVVNILGRSENLTGRIEIFQLFGSKMEDNWLFGFGFGNGNAASRELFGYANAQNALLQWILQAGLLTTVVLCLFMVMVFAYRAKTRQYQRTMPLVILIYVYILLGTVEITFSMNFLMWMSVLFMMTTESKTRIIEESPLPHVQA